MPVSPLSTQFRTAFVTGASSGLGQAFAGMLLQQGVKVWGTSRDVARLAPLVASGAENFRAVRFDLAERAAVSATFEIASEEAGGFDLVINNAGYGIFGEFTQTEFPAWRTQLEEMLTATLHLAHLAVTGMRARGRGTLVNVSSLAAEFPLPFMSGYNVVKSGLSAFSESLIFETRDTNIRVIDFRPGDFRSAFNDTMQHLSSAKIDQPRIAAAWHSLDANLRSAPPTSRAAEDLRRALARNRSGTVRSGTLFQARIAPVLSACVPASIRRAVLARYFGAA